MSDCTDGPTMHGPAMDDSAMNSACALMCALVHLFVVKLHHERLAPYVVPVDRDNRPLASLSMHDP